MRIRGIIPKKTTAPIRPQRYLVEMTGAEIDKVSGIADVPHVADRYEEDTIVKISTVYDVLQEVKDKLAELPTVRAELQNSISAIDKVISILPPLP